MSAGLRTCRYSGRIRRVPLIAGEPWFVSIQKPGRKRIPSALEAKHFTRT